MNDNLTHFTPDGVPRMVGVGEKPITKRRAVASGRVRMGEETLRVVANRAGAKGDVIQVAQLAGMMAAKQTANLIPLCHLVPLDGVELEIAIESPDCLAIRATVSAEAKTGVEMEALTAVAVAALTVYDMLKSIDRGMTVEQVRLEEKTGGRSGDWRPQAPDPPTGPNNTNG